MKGKKFLVVVAMLFSTAILISVGIWFAPYAVGLFRSAITPMLGVTLALLVIATIICLCNKHLRVYSLPLIPHIITSITMIAYIGINRCVDYMGDGFVKYNVPICNIYQIRTALGRVVFEDAIGIYVDRTSKQTLFTDDDFPFGRTKVYNRDGECILTRPGDDNMMWIESDVICTGKHIRQEYEETYICRIRVFSLSGDYITTRLYDEGSSSSSLNPYSYREAFMEYTEEVSELADGVKIFWHDDDNNMDHILNSPTTSPQPREQVQTGHWEYKECPTCYGYGEHNKVDCKYCLEAYRSGYSNFKCFAPDCGGSGQVPCPNSHIELKKYVYD